MARPPAPPPTRFGAPAAHRAPSLQQKGAGAVPPPPLAPFAGTATPAPRAGIRSPQPLAGPRPGGSIQPKVRGGIVQAAFTVAGVAARGRVFAITGEAGDPFAGFLYGQWLPNGARIGFHTAIVAHVKANAPQDLGGWITCAYCNFEYPPNRIQIDHQMDWAAYSALMTTSATLPAARALEVYIGCNDPANLIAACDSCNASKGRRAATPVWIANRQVLALAQGGF
jgi:hypothetical protein